MSFAQLAKLRLTSFVVISAVLGYFIGASSYNITTIFFLIIGGYLVTAASNTLNQVIEKEYDGLMERTCIRPLPENRVSVTEAILFASVCAVLGILMLWVFLNPLSGILGAMAIFMYVALYTPLKRLSTYSVFVGAFPGAIPPMLGWVAATGSFSLEAGILFAIQFIWQFPHFWAIAWRIDSDYKKAGFKMLPYGRKDKRTAIIILLSSFTLFLSSILPQLFGLVQYTVSTLVLFILSALMVYPSFQLIKTNDDKYALKVMLMSYLYLMGSLGIIFVDRIL